jgi:hypothetical protein
MARVSLYTTEISIHSFYLVHCREPTFEQVRSEGVDLLLEHRHVVVLVLDGETDSKQAWVVGIR